MNEPEQPTRIRSVHTGAIGTVLGRHKEYHYLWAVEFDATPQFPRRCISWLTADSMIKISADTEECLLEIEIVEAEQEPTENENEDESSQLELLQYEEAF